MVCTPKIHQKTKNAGGLRREARHIPAGYMPPSGECDDFRAFCFSFLCKGSRSGVSGSGRHNPCFSSLLVYFGSLTARSVGNTPLSGLCYGRNQRGWYPPPNHLPLPPLPPDWNICDFVIAEGSGIKLFPSKRPPIFLLQALLALSSRTT